MNYRHAFHAGNFADVHKHVSLQVILDYLTRKSAPLFYLDTHAGRGLYDLKSAEAARAEEWRAGIGRLMDIQRRSENDNHANPEHGLQRYLQVVRTFNEPGDGLREYPGSPLIALTALRAGDRCVFVEKLAAEIAGLRTSIGKRRDVAVLQEDGYAALQAHLPPKENRGLVFVDPPYEAADEFEQIVQALVAAVKRWPSGVFCVWYPITARQDPRRFYNALVVAGLQKLLVTELFVRPADSPLGLNGSGFLTVNPPWQTDQRLEAILPELQGALALHGSGSWRLEWLADKERR